MTDPVVWLKLQTLLLLHGESLAEHGGSEGVRDQGLLESALARPQNRLAYKEDASLAELAAAYCYGIARNHPFVDGNKRAAFSALGIFLPSNGWRLRVSQGEAYETMLALAAGQFTEEQLAHWIGEHLVRLDEAQP